VIAARAERPVDLAWTRIAGVTDDDHAAFMVATATAATAAKTASMTSAVGYYAALLGVPAVSIRPSEVGTAFDHLAPFLAARKALSDGYEFTEALRIGGSTAQASVRGLTISTARTTGDVFTAKAGLNVVGWERNAEAKACPWCSNLDGVIFDSSAAGDFGHDRCNCTVSPLVG
jgi:hypothetical protein